MWHIKNYLNKTNPKKRVAEHTSPESGVGRVFAGRSEAAGEEGRTWKGRVNKMYMDKYVKMTQ